MIAKQPFLDITQFVTYQKLILECLICSPVYLSFNHLHFTALTPDIDSSFFGKVVQRFFSEMRNVCM